MRNYILHFFLFVLIVGFSACSSKQQEDGAESDEFNDAQKKQPGGDVPESLEGVIYNIPDPTEIPYLLQTTGAEYNESLINPETNVDQYLTTFDVAALNLGIYAADLGYLVSYDKIQGALNFLTSMKKLTDHLGASTAYDAIMLQRFERNLGERDSLYGIINEGIKEADKQMKDENRSQIAALMMVGSFVEGLYISTQLIQHYPEALLTREERFTILTPLIRVVLEQENSLGDILKLANTVPNEGRIVEVKSELESLQNLYAALDIETKIAENKGDELLNDETLNSLGNQVAKMRQNIIK